MSKFTVELSFDAVDDIVLQVMKEDYRYVKQSLEETKGVSLRPFEKEDRKADKKLLKALKRVLRYRMVREDYEAFMAEENNS